MKSSFFVSRPIFASVIAIVIVIAGLVSARVLPIAQNPNITPPTITITATYPGASAETLAKTTAAPIEEQLSGIDGLAYFNSTSTANGVLTITVTFEVGTDADMAAVQVQNKIKAAEARLPDDVRRNGVVVDKKGTDLVLAIGVNSPDSSLDNLFVSNYALLNIQDEIKRVPGVGSTILFGARDYAMRVWFDPDKLAHLGLSPADISAAIAQQNTQYPAGKVGGEPAPVGQKLVYTVTTKGRLNTPEEFGNIVLRADGAGGVLRIKDVAKVELGALSYDMRVLLDGKPGVGIGVFLAPGANALDVGDAVKAKMAELKQKFPLGLDYGIPYDTTSFITASIKSVEHTLLEAALLVVLVVFLFLQSWRTTLIPLLAVPVSVIGSLAGLHALGFSINTMTLFAMVLAIGIVVDDAIVVLENVERLMREKGMGPKAAAAETMREVSGAVVAIVLVLCATFIPVAFLPGISGRLYQQFAATIAISVVISGLVALTLTPALCGILLKDHEGEPKLFGIPFFRPFNIFLDAFTRGYTAVVRAVLHFWPIALVGFAGILASLGWLFLNRPTSFVPDEDQGYFISVTMLPEGASVQRTEASGRKVIEQVGKIPEISHSFMLLGMDFAIGGAKSSTATMFTPLKPWDERTKPGQDAFSLNQKLSGAAMMHLNDGIFLAFNPPVFRGLDKFDFYIQSRETTQDPAKLAQVVDKFMDALSKRKEVKVGRPSLTVSTPQLKLAVDEEKALALGMSLSDVYGSLQAAMGSAYINDFNIQGHTFRVQVQADAAKRATPEDLSNIQVRTKNGGMTPLSTVISVSRVTGADLVDRFNGYLGSKITGGDAAQGVSSGEAIKVVEEVAAQTLPEGYNLQWIGQARQEKKTGSDSALALSFAILMVFLILAAQYEKWSLPLAVIVSVPIAIFGAFVALWIRGGPNDIYFQIGLVTLVGLDAKNGILIVEFAQQMREKGMSAHDAAIAAVRQRIRPIMMTSMAFVLGVTPLVWATGPGSAGRRSLGIGVFGGMLAATFITTLFVPLFFKLFSYGKATRHVETTEAEK